MSVPPATAAPVDAVPAPADTVIALVTPPVAEISSPRAPEQPATVTPRPMVDLPPVTLELPPDSGLVLVETSHPADAVPEIEPQPATGPRRARRPRAQLADEPLQIVETRKESPPAG